MKFSFIIPVYKVEQYLDQCVSSIVNQTYNDLEIILVDDGSPDNCPKMCDEWAKKDERITALHKNNGGLSDARNYGLKYAKGEYIIFLDSDDWWCDNDALQRITSKIEQTDADVIFFADKKYYTLRDEYVTAQTNHDKLSELKTFSIEDAMRNSLFVACAWDKVIRRSVLVDNNIEFVVGQLSEDIEWCCKLLSLNLKYACVDGVIHVYRQQNANSITSNVTNKNFSDIYDVISKYEKLAKSTGNTSILHFLALELILLMANTAQTKGEEGKQIVKNIGKYFHLVKYNLYPRVAAVSKVRFLGYEIVRRLLMKILSSKRNNK